MRAANQTQLHENRLAHRERVSGKGSARRALGIDRIDTTQFLGADARRIGGRGSTPAPLPGAAFVSA
jgi:hypothetical protein